MINKKEYKAPEIELLQCRVERGFAGSSTNIEVEGQGGIENYSMSGSFSNGDTFFD